MREMSKMAAASCALSCVKFNNGMIHNETKAHLLFPCLDRCETGVILQVFLLEPSFLLPLSLKKIGFGKEREERRKKAAM